MLFHASKEKQYLQIDAISWTMAALFQSGIYWLELMSYYSGGWSLVVIGLLELLVFGWVYGNFILFYYNHPPESLHPNGQKYAKMCKIQLLGVQFSFIFAVTPQLYMLLTLKVLAYGS